MQSNKKYAVSPLFVAGGRSNNIPIELTSEDKSLIQ